MQSALHPPASQSGGSTWNREGGGAVPEVALEEDFDRGGEGNGEEGSEESTEDEAPSEDRDDDGEGVEADGFADDLGGDEDTIYVIGQDKDGCYNEGVGPITKLGGRDDDGGDVADHHSQVGDEAEDADHESDQDGKLESHSEECDGYHNPIYKADNELSAKEADEVGVDFADEGDDFIFEGGGAEWEVAAPVVGDGGAVFEEEKEEDRHEDHAEEEAEDAEEATKAALEKTAGFHGEVGDFLLHPGSGVFDGLADECGELFVGRLFAAVTLKKIQSGKTVQIFKSACCERLGLLHVTRKVLHERGSLAVGGGDDVNEEADKKSREGEINQNDADEAAQAESHREFHHRFEQEGKDRCDRDGRKDWLEEGNCGNDDRTYEKDGEANGQKGERCDRRPQGFGLEWGRVHEVLLARLVDEGHALLLAVEKFLGQLAVGEGSAAVGVVFENGFPVAWSLCEADGAGDDGLVNDILKVAAHFFFHGGIQVCAAVEHREEQAGDRESGIRAARTDTVGHLHQESETFEGVILALDWDENLIRRRKGVRHKDAERGGAIQEDVVEEALFAETLEASAQAHHMVVHACDFDFGPGQVEVGGDEGKVFEAGGNNEFGSGFLADERGVDAGIFVFPAVENACGAALGVDINEQDAGFFLREGGGQIDAGGGLSDPSFLVRDGDDFHSVGALLRRARVNCQQLRRLGSAFAIIIDESGGDAVGVFAVNARAHESGDLLFPLVVTRLNAGVDIARVHHIGLHIDDRALEKAVREEVSAPDVIAVSDADGGFPMVDEWRELRGGGHGFDEQFCDGHFFGVGAVQELDEHLEALIVVGEFLGAPGSCDEEVEVVFGDEGGLGWVAPVLGVEMEAEDDIGADRVVNQHGAAADFARAVKKALAFLGNRTGRDALALVTKRGDGLFAELGGANFREWIRARAGQPHFGAEGFQALHEKLGDAERHVAFDNGFVLSDLEPAFLDFGPLAADVTGVDGDAQACEGLSSLRSHLAAWPPEAGSRIGRRSGEFQNVGRLPRARADARGRRSNGNDIRCRPVRGIDIVQEAGELLAGDCVLKFVELRPIRGVCKRAEFGSHAGVQAGEKKQKDGERFAHGGFFKCVRGELL